LPILTIKSLPSYFACHDSLDPLFQTLKIWIPGSGAAGHVLLATYFWNLLEDKDRRLKTKSTLSLILQVNLKLGDYPIWSASSIAPQIKEHLTNYLRHEHLTASMQPRKYSEDAFKMESGRTRRCLQKYSEACSTRLQRARGLVRPGPTGLRTWPTSYRVRSGTWPAPYTGCNYS
jgi:hypothetical protein